MPQHYSQMAGFLRRRMGALRLAKQPMLVDAHSNFERHKGLCQSKVICVSRSGRGFRPLFRLHESRA